MGFLNYYVFYDSHYIFGATGFDVSDDYLQQMLFIKENKPLLYWGILLGPFFAISAIIGNVIIIITPAREKKHTDEELDSKKESKKENGFKTSNITDENGKVVATRRVKISKQDNVAKSSDEEKLSESDFLEIQSIYNQACFNYGPLDKGDDEEAILTNHFNKEFNDFYNYKKGVVWEKIPGYGYVTMEPTDELNFSISQLSNYHKEKICDIIISMICINRETTKLDMYRLFQYSKVAGCSEIVNAKFISKIGHFPDIREWEANKSYTI